ncbi:retinaldehyde-binding protein 1 [Bombyx mori]|uniref:CRAL-TRIO domain-containing protein n=1 Tax=Bombyx mori TaxID=7091 RepID=A0A8R2AQ80_BOMMO|nr:retinaldehyde-binding protein 1 [Bombyx mori]
MTTASVLLTVTTAWNVTIEKAENDGKMGRTLKNVVAEAITELRETQSTKEQSLQLMREWIEQNGDIKNVRQDEIFLLRFLRHKKYSIPMAQQTLLKYLSLRKFYPEIFKNLDYEDSNLQEIINNGYIVVSPVRDNKGRRVIFYNMSKFNATRFSCWDMCRAHMLVYESLMDDPLNQICGFNHIGDGNGISGAHITAWNPSDFGRIIKWGEQSLSMRHKAVHLINVPVALKYVIDFATSKVSQKMAHRLKVCTNSKLLHTQTDVDCLPTLYGGKLELREMIEYTKQILKEQKENVLALDNMEILSTRGIISSRGRNRDNNDNEDLISVEGSFRKLEID